MTTENLTGYTESDVGAYLSETASTVTGAALPNNVTALLYKDFGAAFFAGSAYYEGMFNVSATIGTTSGGFTVGFSDTIGPQVGSTNAAHLKVLHSATLVIVANKYESSTLGNVNGTVGLSNSTNYYYRCGFFSSLGQFGALVAQVFSDSGRTTLVDTIVNQRTANGTYQYFYAARSVNGSGTDTISFVNQDITLFYPTDGINLTTFAEVDPNSHLAQVADCSTASTLLNNETAYLYKDFGAANFSGNYTFRGNLNVTAISSTSVTRVDLLTLGNALADGSGTGDMQGAELKSSSGSTTIFTLCARESTGGVTYNSSESANLTKNTPYWIQVNRDTSVGAYGTLYVRIYSGPDYTNQVGSTIFLTLHDNGTPDIAAFRYLNVIQSYNSGNANSLTFTFGGVTIRHAYTSAAVSDSASSSGTFNHSNSHDFTSTASSGSATCSGTFVDIGLYDFTSVAVAQSALASATLSRSFPGSHDIFVSNIAGHAAINAAFLRITGNVFSSAAVSESAISAATLAVTRAPSLFIAKFDNLIGTPKIQILRVKDATTYDSSDSTYKASPTLDNAQMTMTQVHATLWSTYYLKSVNTTNWTDGEYLTHSVDASDTTNYRFDSYIYKNGVLYYGGLLSDERAAVFTSASSSGILTDEEHNQLMGLPASAENAAAVWNDATALKLVKTGSNKHVLNPADGTIKIYDDDNTTLIYSGLAYSDAAGTVLYNGTAAVHHTTRLA